MYFNLPNIIKSMAPSLGKRGIKWLEDEVD
jgi:hypothetical protein